MTELFPARRPPTQHKSPPAISRPISIWLQRKRRCKSLLRRVAARRVKAFQGWRYLLPADAPAELDAAGAASGGDALPAGMRLELTKLALL